VQKFASHKREIAPGKIFAFNTEMKKHGGFIYIEILGTLAIFFALSVLFFSLARNVESYLNNAKSGLEMAEAIRRAAIWDRGKVERTAWFVKENILIVKRAKRILEIKEFKKDGGTIRIFPR